LTLNSPSSPSRTMTGSAATRADRARLLATGSYRWSQTASITADRPCSSPAALVVAGFGVLEPERRQVARILDTALGHLQHPGLTLRPAQAVALKPLTNQTDKRRSDQLAMAAQHSLG